MGAKELHVLRDGTRSQPTGSRGPFPSPVHMENRYTSHNQLVTWLEWGWGEGCHMVAWTQNIEHSIFSTSHHWAGILAPRVQSLELDFYCPSLWCSHQFRFLAVDCLYFSCSLRCWKTTGFEVKHFAQILLTYITIVRFGTRYLTWGRFSCSWVPYGDNEYILSEVLSEIPLNEILWKTHSHVPH